MATKKEQIDFVKLIMPEAYKVYEKCGLNPIFITAQAALETGWKIKGIGNNIFGITKGSSWTGPVSLELTTEYFSTPDKQFTAPERIVSKERVESNGKVKWRYRVYRFFRNYNTLADCLEDHMKLLQKPMYADAWPYRYDAKKFVRHIVDDTGAKYATAPNYEDVMCGIIDMIQDICNKDFRNFKPL